jgi:hypothetical protein
MSARKRDPWIADLHAWDERIGLDASISHVTGGKKQFPGMSRVASSIPIPLGNQPFVVEMPGNGDIQDQKPVVVDVDRHMWRAYRMTVGNEGVAPDGKKMSAKPLPAHEVQAHLRKALREKLRDQERKELMLRETQRLEQEALLKRHRAFGEKEESFLRQRATSMGFEGLRKPVTKAAPWLPPVSPEVVDRAMSSLLISGPEAAGALLNGKTGKRVLRDHPSVRNHGPPFGAVTSAAALKGSENMQAWKDKCLL